MRDTEGAKVRTINPTTGTVIRDYGEHDSVEVERRLELASEVFGSFAASPLARRSELVRAAGRILRAHKTEWASLMTLEMGKTVVSAEAEVEKCAWVCDYYADNAARFLAPERVETDASESTVRFEPLGTVLAVMPWNFPFWQVFRFAAPALMAGNAAVLKHASNVPGCALAIERIFAEAGFPPGVFQTLLVSAEAVSTVIRHPAVVAVTLTGSDPAGRKVAALAGSSLKKTVLELGGSDPFVVLADADLAKTAGAAATARCMNNGQSCIAAKRFIVEDCIADRFEALFAEALARLRVGDPMDRGVDVGPLAREDLVVELEQQVERSIAEGARLVVGGKRPERAGFFYLPTLVADVVPGMPVFDEETFGPVAALVRARHADEAIELANRSPFGLGASIWTADRAKGKAMAERVQAGCVFVNEIVKSDPRLPFGGTKLSGYGRELSSFGIKEFVNIKTVWIK
ncbi:MAG: NAD-dependent succinate-semialdehyde dehydrogenase [Pseudomonadota bacterium]